MKAWRVAAVAGVLAACNASSTNGEGDSDSGSGGSSASGGGGGDDGSGGSGGDESTGGSGGTRSNASTSDTGGGMGGDLAGTTSPGGNSGSGGATSAGDGGSGASGGADTTTTGMVGLGGARAGTTLTTDSTTTGFGGVGGSSSGDGLLGAPCQSSGDCSTPYVCLDADTNSYQIDQAGTLASIAGGVCTLPCDIAEDCWAYDEWSVCIGFTATSTDPGYCMPFCLPGDGNIECQARTDMVCNLLPTGDDGGACASSAECGSSQVCAGANCVGVLSVCLPDCATDSQCPSDRFCDPASGACVEAEPLGAEVGSACVDNADCESRSCSEGICTRLCTVGVDSACGPNGVCFPVVDVTIDPGDRGRCLSLCDCNADCANDTCLSFQDTDFESAIGFSGFCGELITGDVELTCN